MTYRDYIRTELLERAARRYPNNTRLQMLYQIGFLQAQLAEAIRADNLNYLRFKQALEQSERWEQEL
jgi:hypothetical protein